jgi:hypothetical protein
MNEIPEIEISEQFVVCVNPEGKFMKECRDGESSWTIWVDNPLLAKRFGGDDISSYGEKTNRLADGPLREAAYYLPRFTNTNGLRLMWVKVNSTAWLRGVRIPGNSVTRVNGRIIP